MAALVVEVLDGRGRAQGRARLEHFPATIGRGYGNDVIIDDPFADAEHLRVTQDVDGSLVAEDAGSVNGTFEGATRKRTARIAIRPGLELRIGRTTLRFQDPAQPVRPAIVDGSAGSSVRLESRKTAVIVALVTGVAFALQGWLSSYDRTTVAKQVMASLGVLLLLAMWAGFWSLISRVNRHRFHFLGHFVLAAVIVVILMIADGIAKWLAAIAPNAHLDGVAVILFQLPLALLLISGHLALASGLARGSRLRAAAFIIAGVVAITALKTYADRDEFTTAMKYDSTIRPVPTGLLHAVPVSAFFRETEHLRAEADSLAAKANRQSERR